jgi:hypothetical protein
MKQPPPEKILQDSPVFDTIQLTSAENNEIPSSKLANQSIAPYIFIAINNISILKIYKMRLAFS